MATLKCVWPPPSILDSPRMSKKNIEIALEEKESYVMSTEEEKRLKDLEENMIFLWRRFESVQREMNSSPDVDEEFGYPSLSGWICKIKKNKTLFISPDGSTFENDNQVAKGLGYPTKLNITIPDPTTTTPTNKRKRSSNQSKFDEEDVHDRLYNRKKCFRKQSKRMFDSEMAKARMHGEKRFITNPRLSMLASIAELEWKHVESAPDSPRVVSPIF